MASTALLFGILLLWITDARRDITLTQTPTFLSVALGEKVTINCKASQDVNKEVSWYQEKPGLPIKSLVHAASTLSPGAPARFSGSGSGSDYIFTISRVEADDIANYYCMHDYGWPPTVIHTRAKTPVHGSWQEGSFLGGDENPFSVSVCLLFYFLFPQAKAVRFWGSSLPLLLSQLYILPTSSFPIFPHSLSLYSSNLPTPFCFNAIFPLLLHLYFSVFPRSL
uniref:Ig-like domain-containing protein n=1 Tax=Ornithorhynchus anatinus TaxID=9258 RepID=A0A6I8N5M0_ORNAN